MDTNKYLEYYLDSKIYTNEEVRKSIEETKKEFPNKNIKVNVSLNEFGVYIITFKFENKNTYLSKIKILFKGKRDNKLIAEEKAENKSQRELQRKTKNLKEQEKIQNRVNQYFGNNLYGQYKSTGSYRPY